MKKYLTIFILTIFNITITHAQPINPGLALTFDDYSIKEWHSLIPMLNKYDTKATFFISNPENLNKSQIKLINELIAEGHEIGSHGFNHLNARKYIETVGAQPYEQIEILPSINWFDSVLNYKVTSFAYPYGARSIYTDKVLLKHFHAIRSSHYKIKSDQFKLTSVTNNGAIFGLASDAGRGYSAKDHQEQLLKCKNENLIQVIYAHTPVETINGKYQIQISSLDSILNYADSIGLSFYTISETKVSKPPTPTGQAFIKQKMKKCKYQVSYNETNVTWKLSPPNAGTFESNEQEIYIKWNRKFKGDVKLEAAGINRCGQGKFSDPLNIYIE